MKRASWILLFVMGFGGISLGCSSPTNTQDEVKCAVVDDGNACTDGVCEDGKLIHRPTPAGSLCSVGGTVCDGMGSCVECLGASDCIGEVDACQTLACTDRKCGIGFAPMGTALPAQTAGDCKTVACDGAGNVVDVPDDADVPPDEGKACMIATCNAGTPGQTSQADGAACDDGDACTQTDTCQSGTCGGALLTCDAGEKCVAGTCIVPACTGTIGLPNPPTLLVEGTPKSIVAADFDGDGKPDIATGDNLVNGNVVVFMGKGHGAFAPQVTYPTGSQPIGVVAPDVNGDGKPDLVTANGSDTLSVLLNNGDGTFAAKVDHPVGLDPKSIAAADFNGDGKLDLAASNNLSSNVSVLLGNGDGSFGAKVDYLVGTQPQGIVAADVNDDGKSDIAVANSGSDTMSILLGNGDGTFAPKVDVTTGSYTWGIAAADLNGDGKADLAVVRRDAGSGIAGSVSVFQNNGDGTFGAKVEYLVGTDARWVAAVDLDGDGKLDLAVTAKNSASISVLRNNGDGTFAQSVEYAVGKLPEAIAMADFAGDGKLDLAVAHDLNSLGMVNVVVNRGDGTFTAPTAYPAIKGPRFVTLADLNGDTSPDFTAVDEPSNSVSVFLNNGDGTFPARADYLTGLRPTSVVAADVDGNGKPDLAVTNGESNTVSVLLNGGDGTFGMKADFATGNGPMSIAADDFNGDGKLDFVVANTQSHTASVLLGNGDGTFSAKVDYPTGVGPFFVTAADVNGDGKIDVAVANFSNSSASVFLNNGDGTFAPKIDYPTDGEPRAIFAVDLNFDGKPDLVTSNMTVTVSVRLNNGDGTFAPKVDYASGDPMEDTPMAMTVTDMNHDDKPDVVVVSRTSGLGRLNILLNKGDGTFPKRVEYLVDAEPGGVAAGDVNGDRRIDIVVSGWTDEMYVHPNVCYQ